MAAWRHEEQRLPQREVRQVDVLSDDVRTGLSRDRHGISGDIGAGVPAERRRGDLHEPSRQHPTVGGLDADRFFRSERGSDGTYTVNLTEQGMVAFETALGIANDFGLDSRISPYSTIADLMERTAIRERLSAELRQDRRDLLHRFRILVLRRQLRGSENPSPRQRVISHIGKVIIVALFVFWTLQQFYIAVGDIGAIPGILSNITGDLLQPSASSDSIGARLSDAYFHLILGVVGIHLVFLAGKLIHPFTRIYRKDQLVSGERFTLRTVDWLLRKIESHGSRRFVTERHV